MTPAHHAILRVAEVARAESPRKRAPLSPAMRSALDDALNAVQRQHCTAVKAAHALLGRVCGFCGSREYNCPCRDNETLQGSQAARRSPVTREIAGSTPAPAADSMRGRRAADTGLITRVARVRLPASLPRSEGA